MGNAPAPLQQADNALSSGAILAPAKRTNAEEAKAAGKEFEAFFLAQMLEQMFKGIRTDGPFGGGYGEGVYRSLLLKEYGRILTERGGVGIADMVSRELLKTQEQP